MSTPLSRSQNRLAPDGPSTTSPARPLSSSFRNSPLRPASRGSVSGFHTSSFPASFREGDTMVPSMGRLGIGPGEGNLPMLKQWNSHSYEWTVKDLNWLKRDVESKKKQINEAEEADLHELLRSRFVMTGGHFRVDIAVNPPIEASASSDEQVSIETDDLPSISLSPTALATGPLEGSISVYLALVTPERVPVDYAISTSIFIGIKPLVESVGRRDGQAKWIWSEFQEITFHREVEYWECILPDIDRLQTNHSIVDSDGFSLVLQFHSPSTPSSMQRPGYQVVPRNILDGLASSMDNQVTGDVRLICLEYQDMAETNSEISVTPSSPIQSTSPVGLQRVRSTSASVAQHLRYRKRVIYAHSDILRSRSEWFRDVLSTNFAEGQTASLSPPHKAHQQKYTVHCNSDFATVWWLLHWLYLNELDFAESDDIRMLVARRDSVANVSHGPGDWNWKPASSPDSLTSRDDRDDVRTVKSAVSVTSSVSTSGTNQSPQPPIGEARPQLKTRQLSTPATLGRARPTSSAASRPSGASSEGMRVRPTGPSSSSNQAAARRTVGKAVSASNTSLTLPPSSIASSYPLHFHPASRLPSMPAHDPHLHPSPAPEPASALTVYFLSHQYGLITLMQLAQEHIMSTLTPQSAMPTLLATFNYDELHSAVLDYVVDCWSAVQSEREFLQCIKEVSSGLWGGETGALVLHSLFKRL